jgi:ABC-type branched-subunit amino acid transport system ATPase component
MKAPRLRVDAVSGGYGDIRVVEKTSFHVAAGEVLCIAGRNGVGKSTLLKLATGFLPLMSGTISLDGHPLDGLPPHRRNKLGVAYAPQENMVFPTLSVRENLILHLEEESLARYRWLFDLFPRIEERLDQDAGTLSGGERKLLSFCRTLGESAPVTILDEPSEGVQPESIDRMVPVIEERAVSGGALIIVEQNLLLIERIASHVMVLDRGRCVFQAENRPGVRDAVLRHLEL